MSARVCFLLQVRPEAVAEYVEAHRTVWPELQDALRETGWHNYSLFIRESDGLAVGYLEPPAGTDFITLQDRMAALEVNDRWQAAMARFFDLGDTRPDEAMRPLTEYFHLS